jgi:hypothetical protein
MNLKSPVKMNSISPMMDIIGIRRIARSLNVIFFKMTSLSRDHDHASSYME